MRSLTKAERITCLEPLWELSETFGQPRGHTGVSIRSLGSKLFECRANLALRLIFQGRREVLYVCFLGNHDEVQSLLRTGRYR